MKLVIFYDISKYKNEERVYAPSAVTCIDYICSRLKNLNIECEIVSAAETRNVSGSYPMRKEKIAENVTLTQVRSTGYENRFLRELDKIRCRLWLVQYLTKNTEKNEIVFFWDSPVLYEPLILFKLLNKRKNIKILYFATEIFQEVIHLNRLKSNIEMKLFREADMLLVSTEYLNKKINRDGRPYVILHGTYEPVTCYDESFDDDKIHIVYAGIINSNKGAAKTVDLAKYLPNDFVIHILGYGTVENIAMLKQQIIDVNSVGKCQVIYEGTYSGEEYNRFLQKCHVGLCPQNLKERYNNSSFPSKILTYLSNGLRVVSVDLPAIRDSLVGDLLFYSVSDKTKDIAETILKIDFSSHYDSRKAISEIDAEFIEKFGKLIGRL